MASLLDASGAVVCAGALVSPRHILTSLECAHSLPAGNNSDLLYHESYAPWLWEQPGETSAQPRGGMVRIGNETFSVAQHMRDPRGRREQLALLTLDRPTTRTPLPMDDAGHIGSPGSGECNSLTMELVSPPDGPAFASPWEPLDAGRIHTSPVAFPGYHFVNSDLHETCRYKGGDSEVSGMCGVGTKERGGGQPLLRGTPLLAFAFEDGRQRAVLAGNPQTPYPKPETLNPIPESLITKPHTRDRDRFAGRGERRRPDRQGKPQTPNSKFQTLNPKLQLLNRIYHPTQVPDLLLYDPQA